MTHSWSTTLFFWINRRIGRWPWIDWWMVVAAKYLIFLLLGALLYTWIVGDTIDSIGLLFAGMWAVSLILSYGIAIIWRRPRPAREHADVHVLVQPLGSWKSFPSDHTIGAVLLAYMGLVMFTGWTEMMFVGLSLLIPLGRVWVGVHYPRDIVGGMLVAIFVIGMARWVVG